MTIPRSGALTRLRRSFFALSGAAAMRYEVSFEQIVEHLWRARCRHGRLPLRSIVFIEDLVHAVGCLGGSSLAWTDLREEYERPLIRQCLSRIEESDAIVFVRRYLRQLQQRCLDGSDVSDLDEFIGDRPLRVWLGELVSDALTGGVAVHRARQTTLRWPYTPAQRGFSTPWAAGDTARSLRFPAPTRHDVDDRPPRTAIPGSE